MLLKEKPSFYDLFERIFRFIQDLIFWKVLHKEKSDDLADVIATLASPKRFKYFIGLYQRKLKIKETYERKVLNYSRLL